jgi:glycosyltransferase involved in cell wall biosynthesis
MNVTYWTGIWDPVREGVSKELHDLRSTLAPQGPVVSFSAGQRSSLPRTDRVLRLSARRWITLRAVAAVVEPRGQLTHLFDRMDSWHLLRVLGRRPLLFTVTTSSSPLPLSDYRHVRLFVAQTQQIADMLLCAGIEAQRVRVLWPGTDLARFRPAPPPDMTRFKVLFASTPAAVSEFEGRGISLLVDVARQLPDVDVVLLWRRWGDVKAAQSAVNALNPTPNLHFRLEDAPDMQQVYQAVHATICCFEAGFGKSCPTSVVEGLACGRPTILSDTVAMASLVAAEQAGVVSTRDAGSISDAVRTLKSNWQPYAAAARAVAERHFDLAAASASYAALYRETANLHAN